MAYPSGARPNISSLNFAANQNIANGLFVAAAVVGANYAIRVYASRATHVLVDLAGRSTLGPNGFSESSRVGARRSARRSAARRITR